jgi:hypothetical protein
VARRTVFVFAIVLVAGCGSSKKAPTVQATPTNAVLNVSQAAQPGHRAVPAKGRLDVKITASTHLPKVSTPWRYTVRATAKGKPVAARISVRVLYQGAQAANLGTHFRTNGVWSGTFRWPSVSRAHMFFVSAKAVSKGRVGTDTYQVAGQ